MRKAILYILFTGLFLFNSWQAHAIKSAFALTSNLNTQKVTKEITVIPFFIESDFHVYKNDVLNDIDDYDEYETDNHTTSLKEKTTLVVVSFTATNVLLNTFIRSPLSNNNYTSINISRLPRHNYISLRVLRI